MSTDLDPTQAARADYIAGLRALADLLDRNPDLCLPLDTVHAVYPKTKAEMAKWVRALPGRKEKKADENYLRVSGALRGLKIRLNAWREEVCERVVVDTRTVTEMVPDPAKLAKVPKVKVTRVEEIVEWVCQPILDGAAA